MAKAATGTHPLRYGVVYYKDVGIRDLLALMAPWDLEFQTGFLKNQSSTRPLPHLVARAILVKLGTRG